MEKVIFLDVDGVLNCDTSTSRCGPYVGIDSDKVKRLRRIVESTGAHIVLCSSWKDEWYCEPFKDDQSELTNYLDRKLKRERLYIIDKTKDDWHNRGEGILKHVNMHPTVKQFIIIDDELFDYEQYTKLMKSLVKTDPSVGLQDDDVERAIALLGG